MNVRGDILGPPHGITTGILKGDCKQPLRIGIIRALNECTGRRFRATTRYNHKSSDMQSKKISND